MITDTIKKWKTYPFGEAWSRAFAFIEKLNPDFKPGEYEIFEKDIFARVMEYETREKDHGVLESHCQYIDIQITLSGVEGMFYMPIYNLMTKTSYNNENDVLYYHQPSRFPARIDVHPGQFIVFFPHDAHMPQMVVFEKEFIKKAVVKIKVDLISP